MVILVLAVGAETATLTGHVETLEITAEGSVLGLITVKML